MISDKLKEALEGVIPATLISCSLDGVPNATVISQVWYVDPTHVALSFQFFNKTIRNIRENPNAFVRIIHPEFWHVWGLEITFEHRETEGDIFDAMDIKLEAIASMMGMSDVFKLRGADIYLVNNIIPIKEEF